MERLAEELKPVSASYLRELVRGCGLPMAAMVEGVRQETLPELDRTLEALREEYEAGDDGRRRAVRRMVIEAKDHARLALRRLDGERRAEREEMILRMLTWLENPGLFGDWLALRRARLQNSGS
jgi:hypothetical protein